MKILRRKPSLAYGEESLNEEIGRVGHISICTTEGSAERQTEYRNQIILNVGYQKCMRGEEVSTG